MTMHHLPYSEIPSEPILIKGLPDHRPDENQSRILWRRSMVTRERFFELETALCLDGRLVYETDWMKQPNLPSTGARIGLVAFEPLRSTFGRWRRLLVRDVPVPLNALRPFDAGDGRLKSLGLLEDVGANGWTAVPFEGKSLLVPSLTLLIALASPSRAVWQRLEHPLSMDLACRRSPEEEETLEIKRDVSLPGQLELGPLSLCTLAFWLEERRLPSLHRALEGFGRQGWTLSLPDRPETVNLMFDGYERGDLIVVQRIRAYAAQFSSRTWRKVFYINKNGSVGEWVTQQDFDTRWY